MKPIILHFDPSVESPEEPLVKKVFEDPIAANWWMLWKIGHIVNQYFNDEVLQVAAEIRKSKLEKPSELLNALKRGQGKAAPYFAENIKGPDLDQFLVKNFHYLTGNESVPWEIAEGFKNE